jgi:aminoglycoside phosphotransferase (APT) family kinase protein
MSGMATAPGTKIRWEDLPGSVRAGIEELLGSTVVSASPQIGGFSPGTADRVVTADGSRAFVKAVSSQQNEQTPELHRREAEVLRQLPHDLPVPRFLGFYDDGDWVALVLEDVEGRHPMTPWVADELHATLQALAALAARLTPSPVHGLPSAKEALASEFAGWSRLAADPPGDLDPWAAANLQTLVTLSQHGLEALDGRTVVHADVRADNLLLRPDGKVVVVDWPWACLGPAWLDMLGLLVNVHLYGGHDVEELVSRYAGAQPGDITAALAGLCGYFIDVARQPPPPGLPTVRAFQRAQGVATLAWLRRRLGDARSTS